MLNPTLFLATLLQEAPATTDGKTGGSLWDLAIPAVFVIAIFYFVLIMPEKKKQRARQSMLSEMKKGDKVMTTSGMLGTVAQIKDDVITLQVADGVRLRFTRAAVQQILEPTGEKDGTDAKTEKPEQV